MSAQRALDAGARFLVSPHLDVELVRWAAARGVPFFPGVLTPTEILAAWRAGAAAVKLFPASVAGPALVRELRGPLPDIPLMPTGGVTLESAPVFIAAGAVGVGMGGWLTGDGAAAGIQQRAISIVAAVAEARAGVAASGTHARDRAALMVEVVTLGECLVALVAESVGPMAEVARFERHVAGSEANLAVGLARLGHSVGYIGRVGGDAFGTTILRRLRGEGVDVTWLRTDDAAATGLLIRERQTLGPSEVIYRRAGSAGSMLGPDDVTSAATAGLFATARWLHVTGITPALSSSAAAAVDAAITDGARGWPDHQPGPQPAPQAVDGRGRGARPASPGRDRGHHPGWATRSGHGDRPAAGHDPAELAAALLELGPRLAVIKLGPQGALALEQRFVVDPAPGACPCRWWSIPWVPATPSVPASSAPASKAGTWASPWTSGNACGAAAVSALGDLTGLPERPTLDRLLAPPTSSDDTLR